MPYVITAVLLAGVVWLVSGPLRQGRAGRAAKDQFLPELLRRSDLEAARDAKYREIRDAELDHETGKLSDADYAAIDATLRSEAISVLRELDALGADGPDDAPGPRDELLSDG